MIGTACRIRWKAGKQMNGNNKVFAPGNLVPISEFVFFDGLANYVEIKVRPDLLKALADKRIGVTAAFYDTNSIIYVEQLHNDAERGIVRFEPKGAGIYVIAAKGLLNAFPIITNWKADLNDGRGGPHEGGTDGIGQLRLHPTTGDREVELSIKDTDPANPYYYRTNDYALFAGEPDGLLQRTPSYERYIGETYSLVGVTDEAAIKLSDEMLRLTGYPVIIRLPEAASEELEGLPAFQLVHGCIAGKDEHLSMVSFVLPPYWNSKPQTRYPVLFSGFYDQNENVFSTVGPPLLQALGNTLLESGRGAVGIIWNGGGSFGTRTLQRSVHDNLDDLFNTAIQRFAVDPEGIVTVGGSRGGITSLMAAANPNSSVYKVRYAICYNTPLSFGSPLYSMANPTCPVYMRAMCEDTGYKYAWQQGWKDKEGRTAIERFHSVLLGTSDQEAIDNELSLASDHIMSVLQANGTKIWWTHGTHDAFTISRLSFEWVDRARRSGIKVKHEIGYRFGHNNCTNPYESARTCLEAIMTGKELPMDETIHYRRANSDPAQWERSEQFEPEGQPVFVEGPKIAVAGLPILLIVYGEPDMEYRLMLERPALAAAKPLILMEGMLEPLEGCRPAFSYAQSVHVVSDRWSPGLYEYRLTIKRAGGQWEEGLVAPPQPNSTGKPTLEIINNTPDFSSDEWLEQTTEYAIGWGLSEA